MAKVNEKFVFIFLYLNISTFILYYVQNLTIWIKKTTNYFNGGQ